MTETETITTDPELDEDKPKIIHMYYVFGKPVPEVGDVAYCGHVKTIPSGTITPETKTQWCVVCAEVAD